MARIIVKTSISPRKHTDEHRIFMKISVDSVDSMAIYDDFGLN
jgi:hypothetical protein